MLEASTSVPENPERRALIDLQLEPWELMEALIQAAADELRGGPRALHFVGENPGDPWISAAQDAAEGLVPLEALAAVWARWRLLLDEATGEEKLLGERLVRRIDDAKRRVLFAYLESTRHGPKDTPLEAAALALLEHELGPVDQWLNAFRRATSKRLSRAVLIPTWECELRCNYCWIPKQSGREMPMETVRRSVDMLLSSDNEHVNLQFFGGEALIEYERVKYAIEYSWRRAHELGKRIDYVVSSNGWSLHGERLEFLAQYPVKLELSLDGDPKTQVTYRRSNVEGEDSYTHSIAEHAEAIVASGLPNEVIMVVQPRTVPKLCDNYFHIMDMGFTRVQINFSLGIRWAERHKKSFAEQLHKIGIELRRRWQEGSDVMMVNLENPPMPVRLNGEIHVDWDGKVYGSNGFLFESVLFDREHMKEFQLGHLDDLCGFDRYWMDAPSNDYLLEETYDEAMTKNNLAIGAIFTSFLKWMQKDGIGPDARMVTITSV